MMTDLHAQIRRIGAQAPIELPRHNPAESHFIIANDDELLAICQWMREQAYYFCTMVVSDERLLEDDSFKIYYTFSSPQSRLIILEYPFNQQHPRSYVSIREIFPAVESLEQEAWDLFGLQPHNQPLIAENGFILHKPFPHNLYPLRRTRRQSRLEDRIAKTAVNPAPAPGTLPEGMMILPVGPIHAGVIEAGHFSFHVAGEIIEDLSIQLGYKHKGIEKLFETKFTLATGWELAEKVSGDASFAHSLAYCRAVEALAGVNAPPSAEIWRTLLLELERVYNHIADVGAMLHDISFDVAASEIAVLRETAVRLNQRLTQHRLLRGINRPGGVILPHRPNLADIRQTLDQITPRFFELSRFVMELSYCRERTIATGVLTLDEARAIGATGLAARASGWRTHDFRLRHPHGFYVSPSIQTIIQETITPDGGNPQRNIPLYTSSLNGDVFSRLILRVAEVETSRQIIFEALDALADSDAAAPTWQPIQQEIQNAPNHEFGLGFTESWRGEIFYWVMKGPNNTIFRCKVRDPSVFNWPALRLAVIRKKVDSRSNHHWENILADFPLINKSFNLSYAGHDL